MLFFQVTLFPYFMPKRIPVLSSSEWISVWNTKVTTLFYCSELPCDFWSHYQHPKLIITYIFRLRFTVSFFLPSSLLCPTFLVHYKLHSCYAHSFLIKLTEQQFHITREEERESERWPLKNSTWVSICVLDGANIISPFLHYMDSFLELGV